MNLWLVTAIVLAVAAASLAVLYLVRRRSSREYFFVEVERGAGGFAFLGTAFAVLLAFVVFEAFDSFNEARSGAETEATSILQLSRTADYFPASERNLLEGQLLCYARAVVHYEWPAMNHGERSPVVQDWVRELEHGMQGLNPHSPKQEAAFLQVLEQMDKRIEGRRVRLTEASRELPGPIWFILVLGALLTIGFSFFFADRREPFFVQAALVGSVAALVTAQLLLIWFLDHPYRDETGSIKPTEMQRQVPVIEGEQPGVPAPCDSIGRPVSSPA